jgi:hypothetical protein
MVCAKEISGMGTGTSMNYMYGYGFTGSAMGMNATHDEVCERPKTPDEKKEVEQFREPGQQKIMANAQATEANEKVRESPNRVDRWHRQCATRRHDRRRPHLPRALALASSQP